MVLGTIFAVSAIMVVYLLTDVRTKMAELATSPQDNVQWTLTQLEVEYLTLALEVERVSAQNASDPIPPDLAQLRRRYDILYSRIQTIRDGSLYEPAVSGANVEAEFRIVSEAIFGLADLIDQSDQALLADLPDIKVLLAEQHSLIRRILTVGNRGLAFSADSARRDVADVLVRVAGAVAVLLFTLATMTVLFRREAALSDVRLRENLATSARLESIFSTSRDAILVFNRDGVILNMNRAALEMFGEATTGTKAFRIDSLLARENGDDHPPVTGAELFDAAAAGRQTGLRVIGLREDGTEFPAEISIDTSTRPRTPICVAVIRDITHQVATESELKTSRDMARADERAKARFLGVISHEMRTPLNGILGTIQLIEEDMNSPAQPADTTLQTYLPVLKTCATSLHHLVDDVLDITQIESGLKLKPRSFDLEQMVRDVVASARPTSRQRGNRMELICDAPIGEVMGDPDRLRQVLSNLVSNAIKFTSNGQITVELIKNPGDIVEIHVTDTGMGMTDAEVERVFDDFFRTDAAISNQIKGTGLGLGIARALVTAMDGEIGAESVLGEGSVFWIRLPLPRAAAAAPLAKPAVPPPPPSRILLVEDNATNRLIARRLLENDGHAVTEATNGLESLDICMKHPFDLILMDISMPMMDGPTAADEIRRHNGPNQHTRIVALTAHVEGSLVNDRPMHSMDAILHKPLDRALLNDQIRLALGQSAVETGTGPTTVATGTYLKGFAPETAAHLIDAFLQEVERELPTLVDMSHAPRDAADIRLAEELHKLAGAAASLGVTPLHDALIRAEATERAGDNAGTARLVDRAATLWPGLRADLVALRPEPLKVATTQQG